LINSLIFAFSANWCYTNCTATPFYELVECHGGLWPTCLQLMKEGKVYVSFLNVHILRVYILRYTELYNG
jgi:hypothetical protein